jgi:hypothetical protein
MLPNSSQPSSKSLQPPLAPEAYVKPVLQNGRRYYAIHAQDGRPIALAASRELAFAFLGQQDLAGADVH